MRFYFRVEWILVCLLLNLSKQNNDFNKNEFNNFLYQRKGNVSIVGIFKNRIGTDCNTEIEKGLQEIASTIWTVEALNNNHYLPGLTIGLTILGVCEDFNSQNTTFENLKEHLRLNEENKYIGILTSLDISKNIPSLESSFNNKVVHIEHIITSDIITDSVVQLLINLQWMNVNTVIFDSVDNLRSFKEKSSEEGIIINNEFMMNSSSAINLKIDISSVVVVIASFANISNLTEKLPNKNIKLILTPTDFIFDLTSLDLPKDTIVSLPSMGNKTLLSKYIKNALRHKKFFNSKHPQGPLFIGTAASILKLLKPFKNVFEENCQNTELHLEQPCASVAYFTSEVQGNKTGLLSQKSMKISPDDVEETLKVLKIVPSSDDEMFLYISSVINDNASEDFAIFKLFNLKTKEFQSVLTMINDNLLRSHEGGNNLGIKIEYLTNISELNLKKTLSSKPKVIDLSRQNLKSEQSESNNSLKQPSKKSCESQNSQSQMCLNLAINYTSATQNNETVENYSEVSWRFQAWVSINTSLGFVGVVCTISTILFLIIRLCKGDIHDCSPYFKLLLMFSVIFTYISSLPFHLEFPPDGDFICLYRKYGPPIVFAVLFSLLLSRSILLAFTDNREEFSHHINIYLQFILCIFMFGIQLSVVTQNWIFENPNTCPDAYKILFSLSYDFLLLILLACVSPFIIRSKQNYKEGLLFAITVFFITVVWSTWISFYIFLQDEDKDAAIAIGLNSTASVFLFCIFIPQTYLMSGGFDQEARLRSFSSLSRSILADVNFKSKQALNESAFGTIVYKNNDAGLSNPNFLTSHSNESDNPTRTAKETDNHLSLETSAN